MKMTSDMLSGLERCCGEREHQGEKDLFFTSYFSVEKQSAVGLESFLPFIATWLSDIRNNEVINLCLLPGNRVWKVDRWKKIHRLTINQTFKFFHPLSGVSSSEMSFFFCFSLLYLLFRRYNGPIDDLGR